MKVLFVADVPLKNPTSGSEQVLNQQAIGLSRKGVNVFAITRQSGPNSSFIRNVDGVQEGLYSASIQAVIPALLSLIKYPVKFYKRFAHDSPFQVVICHQPFTCVTLLVAKRLRDIPMMYVFHSPSHEEYVLANKNRSRLETVPNATARRLLERFCIHRAGKVTVLSRYMKQKVVKIHNVSPNRVTVNPGGVDLKRFKPPRNREQLKDELGFPQGKIHLLTVRNLEPRMGLDNLVKAVDMLKKINVDIHLTVGGEGIEKKHLEYLINAYGLMDDVVLTGFISSDILPQYYGAADFFILPTLSLEGFGLVTPESMACGTPVMGTPVGGTQEILSGFDQQLIFSDTSPEAMTQGIQTALERYFHQKEKYDELRRRCRNYVANNYSWERHVDQLESDIEEMIT
jgi:glycosyltransferase involved in cell wall biosynthesis